MPEFKIKEPLKAKINLFLEGLKELYLQELVSVVLYGSVLLGEFSEINSNINILVVLKNTDLRILERSRKLVRNAIKSKIDPLFLSHRYLSDFCDEFPLEFSDMKDNHHVLYGDDVFKDIKINLGNLRFQCEQELKSKLIQLKQQYLGLDPLDRRSLTNLLLKNFTSILHLLKGFLKSKARDIPNSKEGLIDLIAAEFSASKENFYKILEIKRGSLALKEPDLKVLLADFVMDLDQIAKKMGQA